jgi:putative FmdB family regulatory protein
MAFKVDDFKCKKCEHVQEILYKTKEEIKTICEECGHDEMEKILSVGTGDKTHVSWSKWRV